MALFDKLSKLAGGISEGINNSVQKPDESTKSIHDNFTPNFGVGSKPFAFKEHALIFGEDEYKYSDILSIELESMPTQYINGVIRVKVSNGKKLILNFSYPQRERLIKALKFATKKIDSQNNRERKYKYILRSTNGSKLEVYEYYSELLYIHSGLTETNENLIIEHQHTDIKLDNSTEFENNVIIAHKDKDYVFPIESDDTVLANEIIDYINGIKSSSSFEMGKPAQTDNTWKNEKGTSRTFLLSGKTLEITPELDLYNTYRKQFLDLATECEDYAKKEYYKKVKDFRTFWTYFEEIYNYYRNIICDKAMEIIVSEGIWTVTRESFWKSYNYYNRSTLAVLEKLLEEMSKITKHKQEVAAGLMSLIPNVQGGGFGLKGAAKGIATATVFNIARDSVEAGVVSGSGNLNADEQEACYEIIESKALTLLFESMFNDFWGMHSVLAETLKKNKIQIWSYDKAKSEELDSIFKNLSNPNFPQDKALDVIIDVLANNPYNIEYHKYLRDKFGATEEVQLINEYFGYSEM